ncbi:uncharacterized protein LOC114862852 [Betta splendens]|uniref:Uncharacterized protein LOC114862852 n=1 Tax=Betta splendens TaxID=158456 RepID=A0A9W2Y275_BETSP|nr:uncharacterized protein LOC114862852 [Betta splendens]
MSVPFSGWEVVDDGASYPGVELKPSQKPQNRGVYAMYHGTSVASARLIISGGFKRSAGGMLGPGVYVSRNRSKASSYPLHAQPADRVVLELRVRVGRVKRIDKDNHPMQYSWHAKGYDTAWVPPRCGMKAVPSGREEDCVFDPRRVEVVGIAKAPSPSVEKELRQLMGKRSKRGDAAAAAANAVNVCALCNRKTQEGSQHIKQQCWQCGTTICILAPKHFCPAEPLPFSGWEVVDDGASYPGVELKPSQKPQNRGVYAMYHGTSVASARLIIAHGFKQSSGGTLGRGVYVSRNRSKASSYPLHAQPADRVVFELRVRADGYDTAWLPPSAVRLEEDCVFDPKRVEVVGIAQAPSPSVEKELLQLIGKKSKRKNAAAAVAAAINCILHFCLTDPLLNCFQFYTAFSLSVSINDKRSAFSLSLSVSFPSGMSVQFFGWEATYDDDSPRLELGAAQEPKDRGVYIMFHGTSVANARAIITNGFRQSPKGMLGPGVYVSRDRKKAERYPLNINHAERVVLELHVRVGRVKRIDKDDHPMQYTWSKQGYDTAWVPPNCGMKAVPSGLSEDCVYDPQRVKVVAVAKAPGSVLTEFQQLVANSLGDSAEVDSAGVCSVCNRKTTQGSPHVIQPCWGCGQNICPLMNKHVCTVRI